MQIFKTTLFAATAAALTLGMASSATQPAMAQAAQTKGATIPVEAWALRDVMPTVQVSPSGKYLLLMKLESKEGEYVMEIYETENLQKKPIRTNADPMELLSARWVSDDTIFGTAWQVNRKTVKRPEEDVRDYKAFSFNVETKKFTEAPGEFNIVNVLPNDPDNVLVESVLENPGGAGIDPLAAFRPRSYFKYNLKTGRNSLVLKGNDQYPQASFDDDGNPRFTSSFDDGTNEQRFYFRRPGDSSWTRADGLTYDLDDKANLYRVLGGIHGFQGFKQGDPNTGYIIDNPDGDKAGLYEFDFNTGKLGRKLYENENADILGIQQSSMAWAGDNSLVAAIYSGEKFEREWFDETEKALYKNLEAEIPNAHQISISSRSRDGGTMVVSNRGPRDPGSWWLVKGDSMVKIGSRNPLLAPEQLSDVKFIKYPARDGRMIPGYVTMPKGEGPFPLIVLPHGGPHVNEVIGFDEWGQLLANAGYMVLQPQYRMSVGWGQDHFDSANGQHGLAMQDDKDDGALYLVKEGLADPDRMAMFGWSYGGYAALVATSRENNIYQCAIAGAAVADPEKVYFKRKGTGTPKPLEEWSRNRGMTTINPIKEVAKANIPLLMVHGDVDARVMRFNYDDYKKEMDRQGKPAQYLLLEGADHFSRTLMYNHQEQFYTKMLDYLKNDCGPGGL
ncbi:MAG: prolyl oligopeptidase family serine peptidase [Parerythrobacter sp.]